MKGKISAADMKKVAEELNENLTDEEIEKMVLKADSDEDGLLTADDFYSVLVNMSTQYE
jgi:Ca2+-binding EF-hand superfamily protein